MRKSTVHVCLAFLYAIAAYFGWKYGIGNFGYIQTQMDYIMVTTVTGILIVLIAVWQELVTIAEHLESTE